MDIAVTKLKEVKFWTSATISNSMDPPPPMQLKLFTQYSHSRSAKVTVYSIGAVEKVSGDG